MSLNAELCKAVAAALLRAARARALASFTAQSGRISSVVITSGAVAGSDPRLTPGTLSLPKLLSLFMSLVVKVMADELENIVRDEA